MIDAIELALDNIRNFGSYEWTNFAFIMFGYVIIWTMIMIITKWKED
jgi:hypothetical protein